MAEVRKATIDLFESIYPLLLHFKVADMTQQHWRRLFSSRWTGQRDYFGYVLLDGGKAVGFLGGLFHERIIHKNPHQICNLFCWYVLEEFRPQSLLLLMAFLREQSLTITSLTPSREASLILSKFNFRPLETSVVILPMLPVGMAPPGYEISTRPEIINSILSPEDRVILEDHSLLWCRYLLVWDRGKDGHYCLVIFNRVRKRGLIFTQLYYISNPRLFFKNLGRIQKRLFSANRTFFTVVDRRLLKGRSAFPGFSYNLRYPRLYLSKDLRPELIDNLYSELLFLKKI